MTLLIASDAMMAGKVRMIRLETAVGPFVLGLTEKREKVPHPGLQHVSYGYGWTQRRETWNKSKDENSQNAESRKRKTHSHTPPGGARYVACLGCVHGPRIN